MHDVEPISADMLHTVAIEVAPSVAAPGPKNSRILPLPPETVRRPAMWRMMSARSGQVNLKRYVLEKLELTLTFRTRPPTELPREFHPNDLRALKLPSLACHRINRIRSTDTNAQHAHPSSVRRMRIRANDQATRTSQVSSHPTKPDSKDLQRIILKNNSVNNPRPRPPKPTPILPRSRSQELINLSNQSALNPPTTQTTTSPLIPPSTPPPHSPNPPQRRAQQQSNDRNESTSATSPSPTPH